MCHSKFSQFWNASYANIFWRYSHTSPQNFQSSIKTFKIFSASLPLIKIKCNKKFTRNLIFFLLLYVYWITMNSKVYYEPVQSFVNTTKKWIIIKIMMHLKLQAEKKSKKIRLIFHLLYTFLLLSLLIGFTIRIRIGWNKRRKRKKIIEVHVAILNVRRDSFDNLIIY